MNARILVVEDDGHIAEGLRFNLEAEGYQVDVAADGSRAVDRLTDPDQRFDLVILDLMLPEMSGFEVARRTRAARPISILAMEGECNGKMRSTPCPNETFRTVKVPRHPPRRIPMTTPSKTWIRSFSPSRILTWTRTVRPGRRSGRSCNCLCSIVAIAFILPLPRH